MVVQVFLTKIIYLFSVVSILQYLTLIAITAVHGHYFSK